MLLSLRDQIIWFFLNTNKCIRIFYLSFQALDLWMAGCMLSVFAALAEFVVVKVLDVQYQYQVNRIPKVLPMVRQLWGYRFNK